MYKILSSDKHLHIQEKYLTDNVYPGKYGGVIYMPFSETQIECIKYTAISLWKKKIVCIYVHPDFQLKVWKKTPLCP